MPTSLDILLRRLHIVMVGTTHPGNIGSAARAMKTMNVSQLVLVEPLKFPSAEATALASGASDILQNAQVCDSLEAGLKDCRLVFGCSARPRSVAWPTLSPEACIEKALESGENCAIVFGREHSGLSNAELDRCHYLVQIPSNPDYASLNIASAVQILCYEARRQASLLTATPSIAIKNEIPLASAEELARLYEHLEQTLIDINFLDPEKPKRLMRKLQRFLNKAQPNQSEVNILRGILTAAQVQGKKS
ncbi:RNA methyltransferase [Beggiatoa leptomitoformis]|uniref:tRNA (cytidine/uridine-2'-O-)-methyltransferase TrmJ n=1 Tax=Beggiatoa leptomitoformis TaxID=288004 RepID=A0A2N9YJK0_9GAMM|nr:RNA methyltransferase [Beggiatoa leptomitoformis]ALG69442.2 TrmJ/YjtD family RNA methyltransferase [Beggiatoa leptomitoformis]AUI70643.2 TrmJ/YjtD family RNA methyltransferase [Beggiatoa leptomitoformis]